MQKRRQLSASLLFGFGEHVDRIRSVGFRAAAVREIRGLYELAWIFEKTANALHAGRGGYRAAVVAAGDRRTTYFRIVSAGPDAGCGGSERLCAVDRQTEGGEHPKFDEDIKISTPVSRYVPKDRFIPDGMSSFSRQVKRIGDCILAFVTLIVFSPLFLICYIAVKQEDGGPAIFKQERIGRFGRPFNIYKFRSMRLDAEKFGPQLSHSGGDDDPRLTKVGRFLRAHHLDELPQLWNVFCGDMAFIGPRPERKFYIDQILEHDMRYVYLYQIRPGVTSYATLYNGYTDTMEKMLRRLEYDLYYLGHRSWWLDFKVLANTFGSIVFGKKF